MVILEYGKLISSLLTVGLCTSITLPDSVFIYFYGFVVESWLFEMEILNENRFRPKTFNNLFFFFSINTTNGFTLWFFSVGIVLNG